MTSLTNSWAGQFGFSYDQLSRRTQMTRPNPVATSYQYDSVSRLLSVLHKIGSSTIDGATYTHDNAGNRVSKLNHATALTDNYTYDLIYQLTQVVQGGNTKESYTYDQVGNRLSSLGVSPYSYNSSNQLTSTSQATFTYDQNGNTLTKVDSSGTTTYAWDYENRLATITLPGSGGTVPFKYDPFGRRIQKSSASGTTTYTYDGESIVLEYDAGGVLLAKYTQSLGIDDPLAMWRGGTVSYHHADGLGSVTSLTDTAGAAVAAYTTDSFGKALATAGSVMSPLRFTGREWDDATGVYFYRARSYDTSTGRILSEDPIRFRGGLNFYNYVGNGSTNFRDPFGLFPTSDHWSMTYQLAMATFGPRCERLARSIADSNAAQDSLGGWGLSGITEKVKFLLGLGEGWKPGSIHFDGPVAEARDLALQKCNPSALGRALHGIQDNVAHSGADSNPAVHYLSNVGAPFVWVLFGKPYSTDARAIRNPAQINAAAAATAALLTEYKKKCPNCCESLLSKLGFERRR